ncbi:MAG TPA: chemotaxis protein CheX [Polyangiaceae bacterium]|nr:chemotaxis protein CheX [Polyangiaceae bacterium]
MIESTKDLLHRVASQVLEDAAFLLTEVGDGTPLPGQRRNATVAFAGPQRGAVRLSTSDELLRQLTADMLGVEADDENAREQSGSALAELTNILAGALVAELFGTATLCQLGVPELSGAPDSTSNEAHCAITRVDMEGRPIAVELVWHGEFAS